MVLERGISQKKFPLHTVISLAHGLRARAEPTHPQLLRTTKPLYTASYLQYPKEIVEEFLWRSAELSGDAVLTMKGARTRQVAFRLPDTLIERIGMCEARIRDTGLNLSRTDVVRLLLTYALDQSNGEVAELLGLEKRKKRATDGHAPRSSKSDGKDGKRERP